MVFKKKETPVVKSYVSNPSLVTMKQDWPDTPLAQHEFPHLPRLLQMKFFTIQIKFWNHSILKKTAYSTRIALFVAKNLQK